MKASKLNMMKNILITKRGSFHPTMMQNVNCNQVVDPDKTNMTPIIPLLKNLK